MLKNIRNNFQNIKRDDSSADTGTTPYVDPCPDLVSTYGTYKQEVIDCETEIGKYDAAIAALEAKQATSGELQTGYEGIKNDLNNAWKGKADIEGYDTLGKDMLCLSQFDMAITDMLEELGDQKDAWDEKRRTAETNRDNAKANCTSHGCSVS